MISPEPLTVCSMKTDIAATGRPCPLSCTLCAKSWRLTTLRFADTQRPVWQWFADVESLTSPAVWRHFFNLLSREKRRLSGKMSRTKSCSPAEVVRSNPKTRTKRQNLLTLSLQSTAGIVSSLRFPCNRSGYQNAKAPGIEGLVNSSRLHGGPYKFLETGERLARR